MRRPRAVDVPVPMAGGKRRRTARDAAMQDRKQSRLVGEARSGSHPLSESQGAARWEPDLKSDVKSMDLTRSSPLDEADRKQLRLGDAKLGPRPLSDSVGAPRRESDAKSINPRRSSAQEATDRKLIDDARPAPHPVARWNGVRIHRLESILRTTRSRSPTPIFCGRGLPPWSRTGSVPCTHLRLESTIFKCPRACILHGI